MQCNPREILISPDFVSPLEEKNIFYELIKQRRSTRKFKKQPIEKEKIDQLIEAALRSPSSKGFNPWRFIIVNRSELLEKLAAAKPHGSSFLARAPLGIVVCADPLVSDVCIEDASIASTFIHLAAQSLGLGSCWIQIRKRNHTPSKSADNYIKDLLHIPDNIMIESIIAIGYPDAVKKGHPKRNLEYDKVSFNRFSAKD